MMMMMMMMMMKTWKNITLNHLQHRLDVHHVEVGDNCPVDHHDLVTLDDPCNHDDGRDVDDDDDDVDEDYC